MTMLANTEWVKTAERNPEQYGKYRVICRQNGKLTEDVYLWSGGYWVTPKGSPSKGVIAWGEEKEPDAETETVSGTAAAGAGQKHGQAAATETGMTVAGSGAGMTAAGSGRALSLADYEARISLYREQAVAGFIGIGRTLLEAKAAGVVPHGEWEEWVERVAGMNIRQAQRCMQAATEIREGSWLGRIDMSKAVLLLGSGLEDEQKEELGRKAAEEGASVRQLKDEIRKLKLEKVQDAGAAAEIRTELKKAREERDQIQAQLEDSLKAIREEQERIKEIAYQQGAKDQAKLNTSALEVANRKVEMAYAAENELQASLEEERENAKELKDRLQSAELKLAKKLREAELLEKKLEDADRHAEQMALKREIEARQEAETGLRDEIRKEYQGKLDFANGERSRLEGARNDLAKALQSEREKNSERWDEGYKAGLEQAAALAKDAQGDRTRELDELAGTLDAERKEWTFKLEQMRQDLEAAEAREAKRAKELAELKREKAQAGMDAARGIRADEISGLDLTAAVRSFIGVAGVLPQMGNQLAQMSETERGGILAQVDTVARWVEGVRKALGVVAADASIM